MPASSNPNTAALKYIKYLFGGKMPTNRKSLGKDCIGCWVARTPDGTAVTYRPAGTASKKTLETTTSVDMNNNEIKNINKDSSGNPSHLKLKFPEL